MWASRSADELPILLFAVGTAMSIVAAVQARITIVHGDGGRETVLAPEFWVAAPAACAGALALITDVVAQRHRTRRNVAVPSVPS